MYSNQPVMARYLDVSVSTSKFHKQMEKFSSKIHDALGAQEIYERLIDECMGDYDKMKVIYLYIPVELKKFETSVLELLCKYVDQNNETEKLFLWSVHPPKTEYIITPRGKWRPPRELVSRNRISSQDN